MARSPEYLQWANQELHRSRGTEHFLVIGASGSGKSTLINILMKSMFDFDDNYRALVYDPKQELLPILYALCDATEESVERGTTCVRVLHPLDDRCCAWNLALDIDGPVSAMQLATILVPEQEGGSSADGFFVNATRELLAGVLLVFINCVPIAGTWTFRDVILAMLYEPYLQFLMRMDRTRDGQPFPRVSRLRRSYLDSENGDKRTVANIRATISSKLSIYEPIAATWHRAEAKGKTFRFSLKEWAEGKFSDVLVMGNDEASRAAIDAINQAIFKRATELLLARPELPREVQQRGEDQIWFFLDEVREAGRLDGLSRLLTKGRSKGACLVLGFQDIAGMRDVYGEEVANEICGQCNNVGILKLNSPTTADWASELFGRRLTTTHGKGRSFSSDGHLQMSKDAGEEERPYLYTSDFLYLPKTSEETGLAGLFRGSNTNPEKDRLLVHLDWKKDIESNRPKSPSLSEGSWLAAQRPRPPSEHYLRPWDKDDWKRLGLDRIKRDPIGWDEHLLGATGAAKPNGSMPKSKRGQSDDPYASDTMKPRDDI